MKLILIIEGANIIDEESFYDEIDRVFTKDLDWQTGHNLDAFNDLLQGGFGVFGYEDSIKLIWADFEKSKKILKPDFITKVVKIIKDQNHIELEIQ